MMFFGEVLLFVINLNRGLCHLLRQIVALFRINIVWIRNKIHAYAQDDLCFVSCYIIFTFNVSIKPSKYKKLCFLFSKYLIVLSIKKKYMSLHYK